MTKFHKGIAGKRGYTATGWVIHNDAGSQNANAAFYRNWLPSHDAENGFAHVYTASDGTYYAEGYDNMAWHTGNENGNANYLGIEVCQSMGDQATFLANEQKAFAIVAKWFKETGKTPNYTTVKLHKELSSTACPHRSWDLHGKTTNAVKDYYIAQIKKAMGGSSSSSGSGSSSSSSGNGLAKNPKPLTNGKIGDSVKVYDALYTTADGGGRSTKSRGKTGTIDKIMSNKGKKYHVKGLGWAHANDLQLVKTASSSTSKPAAKKLKVYQVSDVQKIFNIWQVRCNALCPLNFNWKDNGIPAVMIDMTDKNGSKLKDQNSIGNGQYFTINKNYIKSVGGALKGEGGYMWLPLTLTGDLGKIWVKGSSLDGVLYQ